MTMKERVNNNRSKKGFTLVELVIVISILAILASIAIPIISTTVNSAKMSALESDSTTVELLFKEALAAYRTDMNTSYNGKSPSAATLNDVLVENTIDSTIMDVRRIGGVEYCIVWSNVVEGTVVQSGTAAVKMDLTKKVSDLGVM